MNLYYKRIIKNDKTSQEQQQIIEKTFNVCNENLFIDKVENIKSADYTQFKKLLNVAKKNDTLVCASSGLLAKNIKELFNLLIYLDNRGVNIIIINENINTTTEQGKAEIELFKKLLSFEKEMTTKRMKSTFEETKKRFFPIFSNCE